MSKYSFKKEPDDTNHLLHDTTTVEVTLTALTLEELLQAFSEFLKGTGFIFDGDLEIVNEDEATPD